MKKKNYIPVLVLSIMVLLTVSQESRAGAVTVEGTPVKQVVLNGKWSKGALTNDNTDQAKGTIFFSESSQKQFAIAVLAGTVTSETKEILSQKSDGKLSAKQKSALENPANPFTLRYSAERGDPTLVQISGKHMLINNFLQEERVHVATANGAACQRAFKYECHAFAFINKTLVHLSLVQPLMAAKEDDALLPTMTKEFHSILSTIEWR